MRHIFPTFFAFANNALRALRRERFLVLIFIVAFAARLGVIVFYQYPTFLQDRRLSLNDQGDDQRTYADLSECIIARGEFCVPTVLMGEYKKTPGFVSYGYRPPIYPFLLMLVRGMAGGHMLSIRIFQALLGALVAVVVALTARTLYGERVGRVAGAMTALYPFFIYWTVVVTSITLCILSVALTLFFFARYLRNYRSHDLIVTIFLSGLTGLVRPEGFYAFIPAFGLLFLQRIAIDKGRLVRDIVIGVALVACLWTPWTIRNRKVFKVYQPLQVGVLENTILNGGSYQYTHYAWPKRDEVVQKIFRENTFLTDAEKNQNLLRQWSGLFFEHPLTMTRMYLNKFYFYWKVTPNSYSLTNIPGEIMHNVYNSAKIRWAARLSYGLFLPFFLFALGYVIMRNRRDLPLLGILVGGSIIGTLTVSEIRIRNLIEPLILILAAYGVCLIWSKVKSSPGKITFDRNGIWQEKQ